MSVDEAGLEEYASRIISKNRNMLIPYYLMLSYGYYILDESVASNEFFDSICSNLLNELDSLEHQHKHLICVEALEAGTGYQIKEDEYPNLVKGGYRSLKDKFSK